MKELSFPYASASVTLLGYGRSGAALLPLLLSGGARLSVRDRLPLPPETKAYLLSRGVAVHEGEAYLDDLTEDIIFRSPGIRPDLPPITAALSRGARLSGEYDEFAAAVPAELLAVTGSDGKTTTATLAARILEADSTPPRRVYLGGNIGRPLLSSLPDMRAGDIAVAELSSFQLMTAPRPPVRAVITNITENHLDWHRGMSEYIAAKRNILGESTHAILNADSPETAAMAKERESVTVFSARRLTDALRREFPHAHAIALAGGAIAYDGVPLLAAADIRLPGRHNIENYMAAIGLTLPYLRDRAAIARVARDFGGVPHRLQYVGRRQGVSYYNSSIDSTPTRTVAALSALGRRPILLCGGRGKGLSFLPLRHAAKDLKALITFGECREEICAALAGAEVPLYAAVTMTEAFWLAKELAKEGDTVLLSPAATSFDEFRNFEERGECFCRLVSQIQE